MKHEEYAIMLNDEEFEEAELWMQACTSEYAACSILCHDYANKKNEDSGTNNESNEA